MADCELFNMCYHIGEQGYLYFDPEPIGKERITIADVIDEMVWDLTIGNHYPAVYPQNLIEIIQKVYMIDILNELDMDGNITAAYLNNLKELADKHTENLLNN